VTGILLIDVAAMVFAMPFALLPEFGAVVLGGDARTMGFLYTPPALGSLTAALTSGWTGRAAHPGAALILAVLLWGAAAVGLGLSPALAPALVFLALMGFADMVSEILRGALLQRHTPDALLGRVSSLRMIQATASPALGNIQASLLARAVSAPLALVAGGLASLARTLLVARSIPALRQAQLSSAPPKPVSA
jgi:MFS transporter, ENTS family, enterobactin (siderophore) exporter